VDVVAREVGEELRLGGHTVVIENRTGAAGRLATEQMLQAPADGGTLVLMPGGNVSIFQHVYPKLKYRLDDLAPLASVCSFSFGLAVGPGAPVKTLKEFVDWAKANPGKASYGTPGGGTAMHFMGVMFAKRAGFEFTHVPYRGGAAAMNDVLGGTVPALATTLPNLVNPYRNGKLRILAFTGESRLPSLPDVPTFKELGYPELVINESFGFYASAKTPEGVQAELERSLVAASSKPRVVDALGKLEFDSQVLGRAAFAAKLKADLERWGPVVRATGYKVED
jgi:tripartite-type tricarboxylate transporter receptor subunit TctC